MINKFISIFLRNRLQYRDIYDFGFLSTLKNDFNFDFLIVKISCLGGEQFFLDKIQERESIFNNFDILKENLVKNLQEFIPSYLQDNLLNENFIRFTMNSLTKKISQCYELFSSPALRY